MLGIVPKENEDASVPVTDSPAVLVLVISTWMVTVSSGETVTGLTKSKLMMGTARAVAGADNSSAAATATMRVTIWSSPVSDDPEWAGARRSKFTTRKIPNE